jgi:hypothetical protein
LNRYAVSELYDKYEETVSRNENFANSTLLWVLNETGLKTVQNPKKVVQVKE